MEYRLLLTKWNDIRIAALAEDGRILEIHPEYAENEVSLREIYMGRVLNIIQAQDAAYIEVRKGITGFLHLAGDKVKCGDVFPVQIIKEASGLKKAAVSRCLSLTGRYCIVSEEEPKLHFSSRLSPEVKREIRGWFMDENVLSKYRILIRTAAEHADRAAIIREIQFLQNRIREIREKSRTEAAGSCLYKEDHFYTACMQRLPDKGDIQLITDQSDIYEELQRLTISSGWEIRLYDDEKPSLSSLYGIASCIEGMHREKVWLKSGGFLVIQPTEALTVIDVNSGRHIAGKDKEKAIYQTNTEAAKEIAYQIRLRNLSGIILVDFINMKDQELKKSYQDVLKTCLKADPISARFIDETALQLIEITRQKTGAPITELLYNMRRMGDEKSWQRRKKM